MKLDGDEKVILDDMATYINVVNGNLYYLKSDGTAIKTSALSGNNKKNIVTPFAEGYRIQYMFIYDNRIYYAENNELVDGPIAGRLSCCDLNGENNKVIIDKATYFPYIFEDQIYFQNDNDMASLYRCNLDGSEQEKLIDEIVFQYIIDGKNIYYDSVADKTLAKFENGRFMNLLDLDRCIRKTNLSTGETEILVRTGSNGFNFIAMNPSQLYYTNAADQSRLYTYYLRSKATDLISQDTNVTDLILVHDGLLYASRDAQSGAISGLYFVNKNGLYNEDWCLIRQ